MTGVWRNWTRDTRRLLKNFSSEPNPFVLLLFPVCLSGLNTDSESGFGERLPVPTQTRLVIANPYYTLIPDTARCTCVFGSCGTVRVSPEGFVDP